MEDLIFQFQLVNYRYISPEQVPIQYGGLSVDLCDCNPEFSMSDPVTEVPILPTTKQTAEIIIYEVGVTIVHLSIGIISSYFFLLFYNVLL